jgi:hypothetical protein
LEGFLGGEALSRFESMGWGSKRNGSRGIEGDERLEGDSLWSLTELVIGHFSPEIIA